MAFPVSPTNGQTAVVNNITYQFSNVGNTWTRLVSTANVITANIITANTLNINTAISVTGNVTGNYILGNGSLLTGISTNPSNITSGTSNVSVVSSGGNVTVGIGGTANVVVFASTGEYVTGVISATGNVTGGNISTNGTLTVGTVSSNLMPAANITYSLGNTTNRWKDLWLSNSTLYIGNVTIGATDTALTINGANVLVGNAGAAFSTSGNVTGGNILTSGLISATGNITGGNLNTNQIRNVSGNLTIGVTSGNLLLSPSGNVVLSANTYINNLNTPVQDGDAATKAYVDNFASAGLTYHSPVVAATTDTLANTTSGTITYSQPNGAGNGVGALLTTTGSFNLIDTANVQTVGTRILVKNEANAAYNGVYTWANATNIVRSTDTNTYGTVPNTLSLNDYFFVSSGNVNAGSSWVVNAPTGTITFGTSNITFAQFSSSQTYTANTSAGLSLSGTVFSAKTDGITTAFDSGGNIIVKTSAALTTPNIGAATGTSLSTTGNITSGNMLTGGIISSTGNIVGGNLTVTNVAGTLTTASQPNITSVGTLGSLAVTANVTGGNILTAGLISATGTVTGSSHLGSVVSVTANVTGGNVLTGGLVSATGNVTGNYIFGNGSQLTGIATGTPTSIASGNSNVSVTTSAGNVAVSIGGTANVAVFATTGEYVTGLISASGNITGSNLLTAGAISATGTLSVTGNTTLSTTSTGNLAAGNVTTGGIVSATANIVAGNLLTAGSVSATANVTGGNILTVGLISATGTVTGSSHLGAVVSVTANVTGGNLLTAGYISAIGNVLGNVFTVNLGNTANAIINGGANGVGNIGTATSYFNTVFGKATTAQYADLAELYTADAEYKPGTVLIFGGNNEVTVSTSAADPRVAGVVSTNPAHLMNSILDSEHTVAVALTGRVPTLVIGSVRKGDMMVSAGNGHAQASATPAMGTVIGKALENFDGVSGTIEIVVGRL